MAFRFQTWPIAKNPITNIQKTEEIEHLILTPFGHIPQIVFDNVIKGNVATRNIILHNPSKQCMEVGFTKLPPEERNLQLNWYHNVIPPEEEISLELTWNPVDCGGWRDVIVLEDIGRIRKDISVTFKSISPKKTAPKYVAQKKFLSPSKRTNTRKSIKPKPASTNTVIPNILANFPNNLLQTNEAIEAPVNLPVGPRNNDNGVSRSIFIIKESTIVTDEVIEDSLELPPSFELNPKNLINIKTDNEVLSKTPIKEKFNPSTCSTAQKSTIPTLSLDTNL